MTTTKATKEKNLTAETAEENLVTPKAPAKATSKTTKKVPEKSPEKAPSPPKRSSRRRSTKTEKPEPISSPGWSRSIYSSTTKMPGNRTKTVRTQIDHNHPPTPEQTRMMKLADEITQYLIKPKGKFLGGNLNQWIAEMVERGELDSYHNSLGRRNLRKMIKALQMIKDSEHTYSETYQFTRDEVWDKLQFHVTKKLANLIIEKPEVLSTFTDKNKVIY